MSDYQETGAVKTLPLKKSIHRNGAKEDVGAEMEGASKKKNTKSTKAKMNPVEPASFNGEDPVVLKHYYHQMLLIRRFEDRTADMYRRAKIGGYCHLNRGEEATIVGLMAALKAEDYIYTNYREHGYIIARGIAPGPVMAELFGKDTGVSHGRGGSMHLFDRSVHFMGGYAIVGGQLPLATGAAYALKYQGRKGVVVCQMGDATTNIGAWHESLNLAALWKLPIIFLIVNNGYGMGTKVEEAAAEPELYKRGSAFRMHGERVDGTDVLTMREAVRRLRQRAEAEQQPAILEAMSFRFDGHSVIDSDQYRSREDVDRGKRDNDPISHFASRLLDANVIDEDWLKRIEAQVKQEVEEAIQFADQSPDPAYEEMYDYMYASPVANTPGRAEGAALGELMRSREK